jgi:CheY-like chemotaxis protein
MIEAEDVVIDEAAVIAKPDLKPGSYVMISVSDDGEGMPPEIRDRIFEPFFTTKDIGRGTGLGLAMVYGFVKQSNGHIQVYSEVGYGTSFKLFLPTAENEMIWIPQGEDATLCPAGNERILVVEDDKLVGNCVTRQLNEIGYESYLVESAQEALQVLERGQPFDLMLTDIILSSGMNGRELAKEVLRQHPGIKVVYTSGYSQEAIIHHGRLDADVLLLSKPYKKSKLAQTLRIALDGNETVKTSRALKSA